MTAWLADKVAPGLIISAIVGLCQWLSHRRLKRHITATAGEQAGRVLQAVEQSGPDPAAVAEARGARSAAETVLARMDAARTIAGKQQDGTKG